MFAEFGKDSTSGFRMQECNVQLFGTFSRGCVDQADSFAVTFGESFGHAVFDAECHVVYAFVAFVEPFLDGAVL